MRMFAGTSWPHVSECIFASSSPDLSNFCIETHQELAQLLGKASLGPQLQLKPKLAHTKHAGFYCVTGEQLEYSPGAAWKLCSYRTFAYICSAVPFVS